MTKTALIYDDIFLEHKMPKYHPESPDRLVSIINGLKNSPLWEKLVHAKPRRADVKIIESVHSPAYVEKILKFKTGYFDPDTYISEGTVEASLFAVGAGLEAVDLISKGEIKRAFCAVRPPGHHAEADRAMGFCIFNNAAICARYALTKGFKKIFIVDFDVHHGNGTQNIFYGDDSVFYFSTHQYPHYPGTGSEDEEGTGKGKGYTFNITMQAGAADKHYYPSYHDILQPLMKKFSPDMVIVSAGYDIHFKDPLSSIRITNEGIRAIVSGILCLPEVPYVFFLEGGYDLDALADSVVITVEELLR